MIRQASELRDAAWASLSGRWGSAAIFALVYYLLMTFLSGFAEEYIYEGAGMLVLLALIPLNYGYVICFLNKKREGGNLEVPEMFMGYNDNGRIWGTIVLTGIYNFLWLLLLIVPGIIKSLSYALTPYILRDHPELKYNGAIELSMKMMDGHKMDLFWLHLTFIGWALLCIVTLGIAALWISPYFYMTMAHFYEDVKAEYEQAHLA